MTWIYFQLGHLFGKRFRLWYWRTHEKKWLWGIIRASDELPF